jgi:hypothetical protein
MSPSLSVVIAVLNCGIDGKCGTAAVHAGKKGMRVTLNGKTLAKGKNHEELNANFKAIQEKAQRS